MVAPAGIGAWTWPSADGGAVETGMVVAGEAGIGETGVSEAGRGEAGTVGIGRTEAMEVENCACAVEAGVGTLVDKCAASEAAVSLADGSSPDFGLVSVGSGAFTGALAAPELGGRMSRAWLKFEVGGASVRRGTASGLAEVTVEPG
jgi:hypothetical protein